MLARLTDGKAVILFDSEVVVEQSLIGTAFDGESSYFIVTDYVEITSVRNGAYVKNFEVNALEGPFNPVHEASGFAPTLGDSEILSIKHPPESHIPPVGKGPEDDAKVFPTIASEQANDVFKDQPLGPYFLDDPAYLPEEACSGPSEPGPGAHGRHVLTGETADKDIDGAKVVGSDLAHVCELLCVREPQ